jgi:hypothetical protein
MRRSAATSGFSNESPRPSGEPHRAPGNQQVAKTRSCVEATFVANFRMCSRTARGLTFIDSLRSIKVVRRLERKINGRLRSPGNRMVAS